LWTDQRHAVIHDASSTAGQMWAAEMDTPSGLAIGKTAPANTVHPIHLAAVSSV
jgi:hypothetical protein